jgi:hypothetical protein
MAIPTTKYVLKLGKVTISYERNHNTPPPMLLHVSDEYKPLIIKSITQQVDAEMGSQQPTLTARRLNFPTTIEPTNSNDDIAVTCMRNTVSDRTRNSDVKYLRHRRNETVCNRLEGLDFVVFPGDDTGGMTDSKHPEIGLRSPVSSKPRTPKRTRLHHIPANPPSIARARRARKLQKRLPPSETVSLSTPASPEPTQEASNTASRGGNSVWPHSTTLPTFFSGICAEEPGVPPLSPFPFNPFSTLVDDQLAHDTEHCMHCASWEHCLCDTTLAACLQDSAL